jgi:hypothetical protein
MLGDATKFGLSSSKIVGATVITVADWKDCPIGLGKWELTAKKVETQANSKRAFAGFISEQRVGFNSFTTTIEVMQQ